MTRLWTKVSRHTLFWPAVVLVALVVANVIYRPSFVSIELRNGHQYGSLVDILRLSAPHMLVALGMTFVIATGGIDLSVGSVVAISGAIACLHISQQNDQNSVGGVFAALALGLAKFDKRRHRNIRGYRQSKFERDILDLRGWMGCVKPFVERDSRAYCCARAACR